MSEYENQCSICMRIFKSEKKLKLCEPCWNYYKVINDIPARTKDEEKL